MPKSTTYLVNGRWVTFEPCPEHEEYLGTGVLVMSCRKCKLTSSEVDPGVGTNVYPHDGDSFTICGRGIT